MLKRVAMAMAVALAGAAAASAQTPSGTGQTPQQPTTQAPTTSPATGDMSGEFRPATTTFRGDTGLWFVPTAEVLPAGKFSFSLYRTNFDYSQGFTDVSNWPVTFGVGLGDRAEIFGAWDVVRRIDRDVRPIFLFTQTQGGGIVNEYPFVRQGWSDNQPGDLWIGGKVNLLSQASNNGMAFAVRGLVKLPTADDEGEGVGTGKADFAVDGIVSKEINERVEWSGFGGLMFRGSPDGASRTSNPSRSPISLRSWRIW